MIEIINLERLSGDGYKMCANNPLAENLSNITHAQLRYAPFTSSQAIQGAFVVNSNSTVEFEVTGQNLIRLIKLFVSTNGTNYAEVKSWSGTNGKRISNNLAGELAIDTGNATVTLTGFASLINNIFVQCSLVNGSGDSNMTNYTKEVSGSDIVLTFYAIQSDDPTANDKVGTINYLITIQ